MRNGLRFRIALGEFPAGTIALHVSGLCIIARLKKQDTMYVRTTQISLLLLEEGSRMSFHGKCSSSLIDSKH